MSAKPLRNSKGVNKPFRSPFSTPQNNDKKDNISEPETSTYRTPLKVSVAKRLLFQQSPSSKKLYLDTENCNKEIDIEVKEKLYQTDLELLRKSIQEKEETIKILKTELSYKKKNKAENLEDAIKKWTECCQSALIDHQKILQGEGGQIVKMSEILSSFNINPDIVHFSINDDTFY
ncbi:swi5-dependent recombination DNA repair protein 1 homolog [Bombus pyrosoma]|uniref:swi5-dependent recombination DNA repair protein 1 homolog n=1 Tax=Bombus pyrosoma TaxID=396416 RepID=UPI001CB9950F|nr:swi5-dependent recombination DNA repair protein 1 homolog [Bombus pyrosoma]XP_043601451.1 swi5-dependent recombination DNA repair protein 1 homolog [Bombus pyrosoma]XP_043601452.1 swi5-dependent recombination DNA repair protein 1 homolog [Bombus pyrosoma]